MATVGSGCSRNPNSCHQLARVTMPANGRVADDASKWYSATDDAREWYRAAYASDDDADNSPERIEDKHGKHEHAE